ncbi:MAG: hypothetical protein VX672_08865 [Planctomycetota bacterium]|nr:hypothetical protein [Planctomycetota bacterium]
MTAAREHVDCAVWVEDARVPLLELMLERPDFHCSHLGGDGPASRSLAGRLDIPHLDDPRSLIRSESAVKAIMAPETPLDAEVLGAMSDAASETRRPLLSMTPRPGLTLQQLDDPGHHDETRMPPRPMPTFVALAAGRRLIEAAAAFGLPSSAAVEIGGPPIPGTLGTRLYDALELLAHWFGPPSTIQAVDARPTTSGDGVQRRVLALLRYPDGRAATIDVGADGGRPTRSATLHDEAGRLRFGDGGIDWTDAEGRQIELEPTSPAGPDHLAWELVETITAAANEVIPPRPVEVTLDLLATFETAMLSTRTGEIESVTAVRGMFGRL